LLIATHLDTHRFERRVGVVHRHVGDPHAAHDEPADGGEDLLRDVRVRLVEAGGPREQLGERRGGSRHAGGRRRGGRDRSGRAGRADHRGRRGHRDAGRRGGRRRGGGRGGRARGRGGRHVRYQAVVADQYAILWTRFVALARGRARLADAVAADRHVPEAGGA